MTLSHQPLPDLQLPAPRGACPFAPPPAYRQAPIARGTLWDGSTPWIVTRYQDVRAVLADPRFSSDPHRPGYPFPTPGYRALMRDNPALLGMDSGGYERLQRLVPGYFRGAAMEALRPRVQRIADELLEEMAAGGTRADLVTALALPLPSRVICLVLGVPYEDHAFFHRRACLLVDHHGDPEEIQRAAVELLGYLERLAATLRRAPDGSVVGRLAAQGELSTREIAGLAQLLLLAGYETTTNMIALSVLALLRNPEQLARLRGRPGLVPGAVDELLRYLTVIQAGVARAATEEVTVAGQLIRPGEGVLCMVSAANRDAEVFAEPDALEVTRPARRHLAFGYGVRRCLGHRLARIELEVALATLWRRLPGLRLAVPFEEIVFRPEVIIYGVAALPVAW
ncbi:MULTISPECIES: cytochrome P450 [Streptomycetaceae]|uniref:Cytochrome P450-SU2 n=1 Tax=Streptantibioticus cattleyicolor (strain ATCC 35852 / DSM 46488 / JCM 4925 / NBRC 14057 / NRRL 8057) TaxID=1003195 RepID=F8JSR8_STREN|nr:MULTISPECIES: cytochrome P450 [Streptomycetaceae]AEW97974.1 cytochrome P450-SU2 [Streptantibioticus cattleyicolor NRRL 8057 = DSM 46488]MYS62375.1 cytochrome P450 [Streptomyces sp. SID5468]CCB78292.1 Cytochrome P450-SU2 [Streptantibioticus cattleyicolor NRRL 8057 = DSM 46488]